MGNKGLISLVEREHVKSLLDHGKRTDGRKYDEYRKIQLIPDYVAKAEGSAICKIGRTKVIAGVKALLGEPYPDTPNEGVVTASVELIPLASPDFESGPPREAAIELARVTDRAIRESKSVSQKSLVVLPGKKVWVLFIDIYILDNDGNLFDACEFAALSALQHTKLPKTKIIKDEDGNEDVELLEETESLILNHTPISSTFSKIGDNIIVDPILKEESIEDARLTLSFTENDKICATQKGGSGSFTVDEIKKCIDIASERTKEIRSKFASYTNPKGYPWSEEK